MTHGSLFSGIGGFDLAAEWMGWDNVFHCEWNPFGQKVLKHHFPNSISYNDITKTDFSIHTGKIDILTGGFPCQPYSSAGKRLGKADERHLFPEMLRCIKEVKPRYIVGENVRGLVSWGGGLVFNEVCDDLEREGYAVQPFLIPAASVGAPHQRQRIWFVAHSNDNRHNSERNSISKENGISSINRKEMESWKFNGTSDGNVTNSNSNGFQGSIQQKCNDKQRGDKQVINASQHLYSYESRMEAEGWENFPTESALCGGDDGIPKELDNITFSKWRNESIKAYGNAIVPQVAYQIFKAICNSETIKST